MSYCKPFVRGVSWRSQNFGDNATIYGPHSGNDEAANIGTPVHAAGDGVIEYAGVFDGTYADNLLWLLNMGGNIIVLNCGDNAPSFVYAHLSRFHVKPGDTVRKGQVIADSGNSGSATTGAHLHVEAIPPGYVLNSALLGRVNPDVYLTEWPEDYLSRLTSTTQKVMDIVATLNSAEKDLLMQAVDRVLRYLDAPVSRVDEAVLDAPITRATLGGTTSLRSVVAHYDNNRTTDKAGVK